jgi:hypothetical protein
VEELNIITPVESNQQQNEKNQEIRQTRVSRKWGVGIGMTFTLSYPHPPHSHQKITDQKATKRFIRTKTRRQA